MSDPQIQAIRSFNRFYTRKIGVLGKGHLGTRYSLTEGRVLYELAHREQTTATDIGRDLGLDAGYLSRILLRFQKSGLVARKRSAADGRQSDLLLTAKGRKAFAPLDRTSNDAVSKLVAGLSGAEREALVQCMGRIQRLLEPDRQAGFTLRSHGPGDIGWVIQRHGELYFQEYGWDERFEALVAEIAAKFVQQFDPARERCWIAEKDGARVGSVFLVRQSDDVAKLRLLLVEPAARGLGVGQRLVAECIAFAREKGYRTITLWTQDILHAAGHIYRKAGFRLAREERHALFGIEMTGQIWELDLWSTVPLI
jgi:DNA-binding MarR family transcriptional regulator/GNAT superfamily N-acetyltransferase